MLPLPRCRPHCTLSFSFPWIQQNKKNKKLVILVDKALFLFLIPSPLLIQSRECPSGGAQGGHDGECYKCGAHGHIARNCSGSTMRNGPYGGNSNGGGRSFQQNDVRCYACGASGHMSRDCATGQKWFIVSFLIILHFLITL